LLHQRTNGNPLFMTDLSDFLVAKGMVQRLDDRWELRASLEAVATAAPDTLRHPIVAHLARLQSGGGVALEAASVCAGDFPASAAGAGPESSDEAAETCLDGRASRGQFVAATGLAAAPGHGWSSGYQFVPALHQEVLYGALPPARR